jgi:RNA polymerase sigma-70 factor (ECF subfamily)
MSISVQSAPARANPTGMEPQSPGTPGTLAFPELYARRSGYVLHVLRRLGVPAREREDVLQEVFLAASRAEHTFDATRPVLPWLHGIAFNVVRMDQRRRRARPSEVLMNDPHDLDSHDPAPNPEERTAAEQARDILIRLMQAIDLDRRAVLCMHDLDGMPMAEIAGALSITEDAGYKRLHTARRELEAAAQRLSARERHAFALPALVPVDLTVLLDADRHVPPPPAGLTERVWGRIESALALADVPAPPPPLPPPPVARLAALASGRLLPFLAGAVTGAAVLATLGGHPVPAMPATVPATIAAREASPAAPAETTAATSDPAPPTSGLAEAAPTAAPSMSTTARAEDEGELLLRARAAFMRAQWAGALAALDKHARRYPAGLLTADREALRAQVLERQRAAGAAGTMGSATAAPTSRRPFGTDP